MDADFVLFSVPACDLTEDRRRILRDLIAAIPLDEPPEWAVGSEKDWKAATVRAVDYVAECERYPDVGTVRFEGMPYDMHLTGGMAGAHFPTDSGERFVLIEECAVVYEQMRAWAIEDTNSSTRHRVYLV